MPSVGFQFTVLDKAATKLAGDIRGNILTGNTKYGHLGALGPDLLKYVPANSALLDKLDTQGINGLSLTDLATMAQTPVMVGYGMLFRKVVLKLWPAVADISKFLDDMSTIANAEDTDALKGKKADLDALGPRFDSLQSLGVDGKALLEVLAIVVGLRPPIQGAVQPWKPDKQRPYEFARWHKTGDLCRNLLAGAGADDELKAYAYGFMSHVASSVTSTPFVNSITGGPYRSHWWRTRLVDNHVDTWTFGRYKTPGVTFPSVDDPNPPYDGWRDICEGNLQKEFEVVPLDGWDAVNLVSKGDSAFPDVLPKKLKDLLANSYATSYAGIAQPAGFTQQAFNNAYVGAYAIVWFMTNGVGPLCVKPPGPPPTTCTTPPTWVTGGGTPPPPSSGSSGSGGRTGSSVALAILALLFFLSGNWAGGAAALAGAIAVAASGGSVDWAKLRCDIYWLQFLLWKAQNAVRQGLVTGTLAYPLARELGVPGPDGHIIPVGDSTTPTPIPLCKSQRSDTYPRIMDASVPPPPETGLPDFNFLKFPNVAVETKNALGWPYGVKYPDFAVEGIGLDNGGILTNGTYPSQDRGMGDAVANAVDVMQKDAKGLSNYNIDGDRGYGWKTWNPKLLTKPKDPPVSDEPEL